MRETEFIKKNEEKWAEYESILEQDQQDVDKLSDLYINIIDDLSYARTFYPHRSVRVYLNNLAQRTFTKLNRGEKSRAKLFLTFWTDELPQILFANRKLLLLSLALFLLSMLIGIVSFRIDPQFAEFILGEQYVEMTRANIHNGDPMAVYKSKGQAAMFLRITFNNIYVAFQTFAMGAFFAVGSVFILISNGVMVGVFQYFFVHEGLFKESFLTIWMHGALEISSIVIAGAAGLVMGHGLLFPKSYSRLRAFSQAAKDGLKIMLGTVPLFIIAGFVEGFLTRQTQLHDALRLVFILLCFAFIAWYYWFYPRKVASRSNKATYNSDLQNELIEQHQFIELNKINTLNETLLTTMSIIGRNSKRLLQGVVLSALAFCFLIFTLSDKPIENLYVFNGGLLNVYYNIYVLLGALSDKGTACFVAAYIGIYLLLVNINVIVAKETVQDQRDREKTSQLMSLVLPSLLIALSISLKGIWFLLANIVLLPFLLLYAYTRYNSVLGIRQTLRFYYNYSIGNYSLFLVQILLGVFIFLLMDTAIVKLVFGFLSWLFSGSPIELYRINVVIQAFVYFIYFGGLISTLYITMALNFHSNKEKEEALGLRLAIKQIGHNRRIQGLEME